jgi:hypothetical protein
MPAAGQTAFEAWSGYALEKRWHESPKRWLRGPFEANLGAERLLSIPLIS